MTTFANPFDSFANMQTEEDFMEVSNDQERKNAMDEDHFDIDIDLMDGQDENEDEDSMMDDEPSGQDGDQDQQMDDDDEELATQDAEIIDFIDDVPANVEIPMTEESTAQDQDPITSVQSLFNPSHVPETPVFAPVAAHLSPPEVPAHIDESETFHDGSSFTGTSPQLAPSIPVDSAVGSEPTQNSHKVLGPESQDNEADANAQSVTRAESTIEVAPEGTATERQNDEKGSADHDAQRSAQTRSDSTPAEDHSTSSFSILRESPAGQAPQAQDSYPAPHRLDPQETDAGILSEELENDHKDATEAGEPAPVSTAQDRVPNDAEVETPEPPLPVLVTYQGHQMALFPPVGQDDGSPEVYLLPDSSIFDKPINKFLDVCQGHLEESLEQNEGIEIEFPSFGFTVRQYDPEASRHTLRDIAELCFQFQQHDGVDKPQPLKMNLKVISSLTGHLSYLYDLAAECKGLKYVEDLYSSNLDAENDDFGDYPEEEKARSVEEPRQPQAVATDQIEEPVGSTLATLGDVLVENPRREQHGEADMAHGERKEVKSPIGTAERHDQQANQEANIEDFEEGMSAHDFDKGEVSQDTFDPAVDAQTAEEIDFGDEEEWDIQEPTNTAEPYVADGQGATSEQAIEQSQSLRSATQLDTKVATHLEPTATLEHQNELENPANDQPAHSDTSSTTLEANDTVQPPATTDADNGEEDDEDIFDDEDDYAGVDNLDDQGDQDEIDFGPDDHESKSPSLKRIRSEVDEVGDEADADEVHPLKRSRSG